MVGHGLVWSAEDAVGAGSRSKNNTNQKKQKKAKQNEVSVCVVCVSGKFLGGLVQAMM